MNRETHVTCLLVKGTLHRGVHDDVFFFFSINDINMRH